MVMTSSVLMELCLYIAGEIDEATRRLTPSPNNAACKPGWGTPDSAESTRHRCLFALHSVPHARSPLHSTCRKLHFPAGHISWGLSSTAYTTIGITLHLFVPLADSS